MLAAGARAPSRRAPRARLPRRYDLAIPENERKLEAADALGRLADEARLSLIQPALAFVIRHPAVTAAIIGPRTMEQLEPQLGADDVELDDATLDRIDEIGPPGPTIRPATPGGRTPRSTSSAGRPANACLASTSGNRRRR